MVSVQVIPEDVELNGPHCPQIGRASATPKACIFIGLRCNYLGLSDMVLA